MDVRTLMEMNDYVTDKLEQKSKWINEWLRAIDIASKQLATIIDNNFGLMVALFIFAIMWFDMVTFGEAMTVACLMYALRLISKEIDDRTKYKLISELDIERLAQTKNTADSLSKLSINEIIGQYVEDCFNRDVLFLNPPKDDDYITEAQEKEYLNTLIDSATTNISQLMYEKLSYYVGKESLSVLIGRKCLATVTIFVATHNRKMYNPIDESKTIRTSNMPE